MTGALPLEDLLAIAGLAVAALAAAALFLPAWRKTATWLLAFAALPLAAALAIDAWSGHAMRPLPPHGAPVAAMAMSPDEAMLAVADQSGTIRVSRPGNDSVIYETKLDTIRALHLVDLAGQTLLAAVDGSGAISWFDPLSGNAAPYETVGATPSVQAQAPVFANAVYIGSAASGTFIGVLRAGTLGDPNVENAYEILFGESSIAPISLPARPTAIAHYEGDASKTVHSEGAGISFVIGFADGTVGLIAFLDDVTPSLFMPSGSVPSFAPKPIVRLASSPDNDIASVDSEGRIALWRLDEKTGAPERRGDFIAKAMDFELQGHAAAVTALAWSPDGARLATASEDGTGRVWDAATGKEIAVLSGHQSFLWNIDWSPDGTRIATVSEDKTGRIWDAASGREILVLRGHESFVWRIRWSPDGTRLVTASEDDTARVWDAATGDEIATLKSAGGNINLAAWSPDGTRVATASDDKTCRVWNASTGAMIAEFAKHADGVRHLGWNPDGLRIASASVDKTARIWEAATGREIAVLKGHDNTVYDIAWSPDGKRLATATYDNTARVWDGATGRTIAVLAGHENVIFQIRWSPDGGMLATASEDATGRIWDADTGREIAVLKGHGGRLNAIGWNAEGTAVATASGDGTARIWDARADSDRVLRCRDCRYIGFRPGDGTLRIMDGAGHQIRFSVVDARGGLTIFGWQVADVPQAAAPHRDFLLDPASFTRLVAQDDGSLAVEDGPNGGATLPPHTGLVSHALVLKGGRIVTGAIDGTVRVIDPGMHSWLDRFDVWPEIAGFARAALATAPAEPVYPAGFERAVFFALQQDGETLGLGQNLYDTMRASAGKPSRPVGAMDGAELRELTYANFWRPLQLDGFDERPARVLFDTALVRGTRDAVLFLQEAIGQTQDGLLGQRTLAGALSADPRELARRLLDIRLARSAVRGIDANRRTEARLDALAESAGIDRLPPPTLN